MSEKIKVHFLSCEGQSKYTKTVVITILRNVKLFLSFKDTIQQKRFKSNKKIKYGPLFLRIILKCISSKTRSRRTLKVV